MNMTTKLKRLAKIEGFDDPIDMLVKFQLEGAVPCICMNEECDSVEHWEPDCRDAQCPVCHTPTMKSCIELMIEGDL